MQKTKIRDFIMKNIIVKNILLAIFILFILIVCSLLWLKSYTRHNQVVSVPNVKGLSVREAAPYLQKAKLRFDVIDSVYRKDAKPGTIVDIVPPANSKVKETRIVFLTVNAVSTRTLVVPEVQDISQRQAVAMLRSVGFENIDIEYIDSSYKDLVLGLKYNGRDVKPGERIPVSGRLILVVSSGFSDTIDTTVVEESIIPVERGEDSWF